MSAWNLIWAIPLLAFTAAGLMVLIFACMWLWMSMVWGTVEVMGDAIERAFSRISRKR